MMRAPVTAGHAGPGGPHIETTELFTCWTRQESQHPPDHRSHNRIIAAGTSPAEVAAAEVFESAAPSTVTVWVAPHAPHTGAYDTHPE